ncbi:hypothetical protein C6P40_001871 [Pichia californica]|uniref:SWIRM domain-containing protein n=1 Tax=Pichia californica TaxID=460514 RepID=A0A9P6WIX2_9ASCO|nr:hypothetical protein C6P42_001955 [[Candida] californica]KAG0687776.1 hypothetical protein C6P40_001871 [[Candida] californica]
MSLIARDSMTPLNDPQHQQQHQQQQSFISNTNTNIPEKKMINSMTQSSSVMDMPSPPLSPYTRNNYDDNDTIPALLFPRASKPLTSDLRYLELNSSTIVPVLSNQSKSPIHSATSVSPEPFSQNNNYNDDDNNNNDNNNDNDNDNVSQASSPINDEIESNHELQSLNTSSILHIDPYKSLNKPGFKKNQLNFLSQYQFKNFNSFNSYSSTYSYFNNINSINNNNNNSLTLKRQRQIRHNFDSLKNQIDNSNSDSELERPRTRRIVRQNNFDLEIDENKNYDSSSISRPSTPIKKKANISNPTTPKRQRTCTPVIYNYDYKKIEDFCPPFDTLPNNNKCLKTDWKGQSMDLSNDPLVNELHPAEVVLASILRLPCAVYLDSKRRIFQEKVKRMRYNLPFRRTDAQKSCKIDVNKASRLFASFEKVGWFNESHFQKYL